MREWDKMLAGMRYNPSDPALLNKRQAVRVALAPFNSSDGACPLPEGLLGKAGQGMVIGPPFRCDYGENISIGRNFFGNSSLTVLDEARVTIGDNCQFGPNVSLLTACHPTSPEERRTGVEWALPIAIGDDVWLGGGVTVLPGVTIGEGSTIGAGSVVTHDIPPRSVAYGNPCLVRRKA